MAFTPLSPRHPATPFGCLLAQCGASGRGCVGSEQGVLWGPTLYLSQTSARPGDSVRLQCSVFSRAQATRVIFWKDGEEVSSRRGILQKLTYNYDHVVSGGSTRNYSCGYEIKDSKNQVIRSQLSPAQHLSVTGDDSNSGGVRGSSPQGPDMLSITIWATRCTLVLLLLVSAPIITFMLEKWSLPQPVELEETYGGSMSFLREEVVGDPH